jgi:hypothetical protein
MGGGDRGAAAVNAVQLSVSDQHGGSWTLTVPWAVPGVGKEPLKDKIGRSNAKASFSMGMTPGYR